MYLAHLLFHVTQSGMALFTLNQAIKYCHNSTPQLIARYINIHSTKNSSLSFPLYFNFIEQYKDYNILMEAVYILFVLILYIPTQSGPLTFEQSIKSIS
jgi:hypothetical protein